MVLASGIPNSYFKSTLRGVQRLLDELTRLLEERADIDGQIYDVVESARREGVTWKEIGEALGITKQSAWERFTKAS